MKFTNSGISKKSTGSRRTYYYVFFALLILAPVTLFILEKSGVTNFYQRDSNISNETLDKTTSDAPSAQEDFNSGDEREPGNTLLENAGSGDIIDGNGIIDQGIDISDAITSSTGEITLYAPKENASLEGGDSIAGKSSLPKVTYRLIDSLTGVIASGELKVVNGTFSGKIVYSTSASEGRLDIFGTNKDFSEFSNIEIPVRFRK